MDLQPFVAQTLLLCQGFLKLPNSLSPIDGLFCEGLKEFEEAGCRRLSWLCVIGLPASIPEPIYEVVTIRFIPQAGRHHGPSWLINEVGPEIGEIVSVLDPCRI